MKLFTSILFTVFMALMISAGTGISGAITVPTLLSAGVVTSILPLPKEALYAKLGDFAASTTTTIQLRYLPEFITFVATSIPTLLRIEVLGDGTVMNLDAAGVETLNNLTTKGTQANRYTFQVANGLIKDKNVEITMTNAVAGTVSMYGFSPDGEGDAYLVYQKNTVLADSGFDVQDFSVVGLDSPTANDIFIMEYEDGTQDKLSIEEIDAYQTYKQNYDPSSAGLVIFNFQQQLRKVNITPSTDRIIYFADIQPVGDIDNVVN